MISSKIILADCLAANGANNQNPIRIVYENISRIADFSQCSDDERSKISTILNTWIVKDVSYENKDEKMAINLASHRASLALVKIELLAKQKQKTP